jgi:hypothetical protein
MNRLTLAVFLVALPSLGAAQYGAPVQPQQVPQAQSTPTAAPATAAPAGAKVNIPKADCVDAPQYPGVAAMRVMDSTRKRFESQLARYKECMLAYIEQQKALVLGHQDAYKSAVDQYNTAIKEIMAAQEGANR